MVRYWAGLCTDYVVLGHMSYTEFLLRNSSHISNIREISEEEFEYYESRLNKCNIRIIE